MLSRIQDAFNQLSDLIGPRIYRLALLSAGLAILWFGVEAAFVLVLRGFLHSIDLIPKGGADLPDYYPKSLHWSLLVFIGYSFVRCLIQFIKYVYMASTVDNFVMTHKSALLRYGMIHVEEVDSYQFIDAFTERTNKSGEYLRQILSLIHTTLTSVLLLALCLSFAPLKLVIGGATLALIAWPLGRLNAKIQRLGHRVVATSNEVTAVLIGGINNSTLLNFYGLMNREARKGRQLISEYRDIFSKYHVLSGLKQVVPTFMAIIVLSGIAIVSSFYSETSSTEFLAFFYFFLRISQNLSYANSATAAIRLYRPSINELQEWHKLIDVEPLSQQTFDSESPHIAASMPNEEIAITLLLHDVAYGYSNHMLFEHLNLELAAGESLLIKGPTGIGKSTLLSLIAGIKQPTFGHIRLNGLDPYVHKAAVAPLIGYVGPENFLIPGTLLQNLGYGRQDAVSDDIEALDQILATVQLQEVLAGLRHGLDTVFKDSSELSTGQKQRIGLARALARRPRLLLLDEATSGLDVQTETKLIDALFAATPTTIKIIITHRTSLDRLDLRSIDLSDHISQRRMHAGT